MPTTKHTMEQTMPTSFLSPVPGSHHMQPSDCLWINHKHFRIKVLRDHKTTEILQKNQCVNCSKSFTEGINISERSISGAEVVHHYCGDCFGKPQTTNQKTTVENYLDNPELSGVAMSCPLNVGRYHSYQAIKVDNKTKLKHTAKTTQPCPAGSSIFPLSEFQNHLERYHSGITDNQADNVAVSNISTPCGQEILKLIKHNNVISQLSAQKNKEDDDDKVAMDSLICYFNSLEYDYQREFILDILKNNQSSDEEILDTLFLLFNSDDEEIKKIRNLVRQKDLFLEKIEQAQISMPSCSSTINSSLTNMGAVGHNDHVNPENTVPMETESSSADINRDYMTRKISMQDKDYRMLHTCSKIAHSLFNENVATLAYLHNLNPGSIKSPWELLTRLIVEVELEHKNETMSLEYLKNISKINNIPNIYSLFDNNKTIEKKPITNNQALCNIMASPYKENFASQADLLAMYKLAIEWGIKNSPYGFPFALFLMVCNTDKDKDIFNELVECREISQTSKIVWRIVDKIKNNPTLKAGVLFDALEFTHVFSGIKPKVEAIANKYKAIPGQ